MGKCKTGTALQAYSNVYSVCSRALSRAINEIQPEKPKTKDKKDRTGGNPKMTDDDVIEARRLHEKCGVSCKELANKYGMTNQSMYNILTYTTRSKNLQAKGK